MVRALVRQNQPAPQELARLRVQVRQVGSLAQERVRAPHLV